LSLMGFGYSKFKVINKTGTAPGPDAGNPCPYDGVFV
jgi:hypothetical protein